MTIILACFSLALSIVSLLFSLNIIELKDKKALNKIREDMDKLINKDDKYKDYRNENGLLGKRTSNYKINK